LAINKFTSHKPLFITGIIVLTLILAIAICEVIGWPFLKDPLANFMAQKLEREVRIDRPFKLRFIGGPRLTAGGLWISAPPGFDVPHLVEAKNLELKLRYSDLFNIKDGEPYVIKSIKADYLDARLNRKLDGKSTWQFKKDPNEPIRPFPIIQALVIREGQALVVDELTRADLQVKFDTNEGKNNQAPLSKVAVKGQFRDQNLVSELTTQGFLPIASQTAESGGEVSSKGWLRYGKVYMQFDGSVDNLFGEQTVKGKVAVKGDSLGDLGDLLSITLPRTTAFKIAGNIEKNPEGWIIDVKSANVGQSQLYGYFEYDTQPEVSMLKGTLKGKRLVITDLAPAFGSTPTEKGKVRERVFPDKPLDFATYNRMNAEINIDIDYVDLGNAFREPISPFKASLDLNKNKLSLAKIYAKTAQGTIAGDIFIDAHERKTANPIRDKDNPALKPDWGINLSLKNINLEKWLTISQARKDKAKAEGKPTTSQAYVTGFLNAQSKLKGKGNSTAELLRTLNGDLSMYVRDGEISRLIIEAVGLDVAQAVGLLIKGDNNLKMDCAVVDFKADKGVMRSNVSLVDTSLTTIVLDGNVDMGDEQLDLLMTAEPKNFSPFTVRSPIKITGTFLNPKVSPKATPIAARAIGGILLAFVNPLAAILPFLDPGKVGDAELTCDDTLQNLRKNVKVPNKDEEAQEAKQDDAQADAKARDRKAQAEKNAEVHQTQINEVR
jgi:AsmA family protein